jgi:hypothetical protein
MTVEVEISKAATFYGRPPSYVLLSIILLMFMPRNHPENKCGTYFSSEMPNKNLKLVTLVQADASVT